MSFVPSGQWFDSRPSRTCKMLDISRYWCDWAVYGGQKTLAGISVCSLVGFLLYKQEKSTLSYRVMLRDIEGNFADSSKIS